MGFGMVATLALFVSVVVFPVVGMVVGVFAPLPTVLSAYRWGFPIGFAVPGGSLILGLILFGYLGMMHSLPYLVEMLVLGLLLGAGMRRNWSLEKTVAVASLVAFSLGIQFMVLGSDGGLQGLMEGLEKDLKESLGILLQQYGATSLNRQQLEEVIQGVAPLLVRLLPGAILSSTVVACWLNLLVVKRYCRFHRLPLPDWPEWPLWKAPESLVWVVIGSGVLILTPVTAAKTVGLNGIMAVGIVFLLQGLAIAAFFFDRWRLPRMVRALLYVVILVQQFATLGAVLVGLFDVWFDFRRLSRPSAANA